MIIVSVLISGMSRAWVTDTRIDFICSQPQQQQSQRNHSSRASVNSVSQYIISQAVGQFVMS